MTVLIKNLAFKYSCRNGQLYRTWQKLLWRYVKVEYCTSSNSWLSSVTLISTCPQIFTIISCVPMLYFLFSQIKVSYLKIYDLWICCSIELICCLTTSRRWMRCGRVWVTTAEGGGCWRELKRLEVIVCRKSVWLPSNLL